MAPFTALPIEIGVAQAFDMTHGGILTYTSGPAPAELFTFELSGFRSKEAAHHP
jgi:hypothetical protein